MKPIAMLCMAALLVVATASHAQSFTDASANLPGTYNSGGTVGVCDMDQDGLDDVVVIDQATDVVVLYQQPDGSLVASPYGTLSNSNQWGMAVADVNNDGHNDIFSGGSYDGTHLMIMYGSGSYDQYGLDEGDLYMQGANLADMNNDGWLDAFGCHDDAESRIWTNDGAGALAPANDMIDMATTPASDNSGNYGSVWTDFDRDGDIDLYIAKCRQFVSDPLDMRRINALFENDGSGNFSNTTDERGMIVYEQSWTSDFADVDNDGDFDLFLTNHSNTCMLLENDGTGHFSDISAGSGLDLAGFFLQAKFVDFDNDGWLDVVFSGGGGVHRLMRNNGDQTFTEVEDAFPANDAMHSFAIGDLNKDGWLDLYASYGNGYVDPDFSHPDRLWMNDGGTNNWIAFELTGTTSNVNAVGALVQIDGAFGTQIREVRSGESYGITNSFQMHFGLGSETAVETVTVFWPSGETTVLTDPTVNAYNEITEGSCQLGEMSITVTGETTICQGQSVELAAPSGMGYNYVWSNGATEQSIQATASGNYTVVVYDAQGCSAASGVVEVNVIVVPPPTVSSFGPLDGCEGTPVILQASDGLSYLWSDGSTGQELIVTTQGTYSVEVAFDGECSGVVTSDPVTVTFAPAPNTPVVEDIFIDAPGEEGTFIGDQETLNWYINEDDALPTDYGQEFTVSISEPTTYWVAAVNYEGGAPERGGLEEINDVGQYHTNPNFYNTFDANEDITIESVKVFAEFPGDRVIAIVDSNGGIVDQGTYYVEAGEQRVYINLDCPAGTGYGLRSLDNNPNMWRDEYEFEDLPYPYAVGGYLDITGTNIDSNNWDNFWYFFYDWSVHGQGAVCTSERIPVVASFTGIDDLVGTSLLQVYPNPAEDQVRIDVESLTSGQLTVALFDAVGREVLNGAYAVAPGTQSFNLALDALHAGHYALTFELNGARASRQLVVR